MDKARLQRLHRQIAACEGNQAVMRNPGKSFYIVPVASARFQSIMRDPVWSARVQGVFSPDVSWPVFFDELVGGVVS